VVKILPVVASYLVQLKEKSCPPEKQGPLNKVLMEYKVSCAIANLYSNITFMYRLI
jgi:hypothetical protein